MRYVGHTELPGTVNEAMHRTLSDLLNEGVSIDDSERGASIDLLAYQTGMTRPTARIATSDRYRLNITTAVARFVWMIAGSDRLEDIAYYEPKVRPFTDDNIAVPGSSYGQRIFRQPMQTSQVDGAVERLRRVSSTRQAAIVIWLPEDAVRLSADIPCAFGLFFHRRGDSLVATCAMRSNNAVRLLPFNFFEFSLLSELVAAEVGIPLGGYSHWSASMHVFEHDRDLAEDIIASAPGVATEMPPIPAQRPMQQARAIAQWEARVRHAPTVAKILEHRRAASDQLHPYWLALLDVIVLHNLEVRGAADDGAWGIELPGYFRSGRETELRS